MTKQKILLVEDNEQNRYLATFLLEQRGHVGCMLPPARWALRWPPARRLT